MNKPTKLTNLLMLVLWISNCNPRNNEFSQANNDPEQAGQYEEGKIDAIQSAFEKKQSENIDSGTSNPQDIPNAVIPSTDINGVFLSGFIGHDENQDYLVGVSAYCKDGVDVDFSPCTDRGELKSFAGISTLDGNCAAVQAGQVIPSTSSDYMASGW